MWTPVIDGERNALTIFLVGDAHLGAARQCAVGSSHTVFVERSTARDPATATLIVMRSDALFGVGDSNKCRNERCEVEYKRKRVVLLPWKGDRG